MILVIFYTLWTLILGVFGGFGKASLQSFEDSRDGNRYAFKEINGLNWMTENLRYKTESSMTISDSANCDGCGEFYGISDVFNVCPEGWRLPKEEEVKKLVKWHKKNKTSVTKNLEILLVW